MKRLFVLLVLIGFVFSGCAAAPLAGSAISAFSCFKTAQAVTGGDIEVRFKDIKLSIEDKQVLSSIKCIAVYPSMYSAVNESTLLAEALSKNKEYSIVSPYSVREKLTKSGGVANLEEMMDDERLEKFHQVCGDVRAEGLFVLSTSQGEARGSLLSLSRDEFATNFSAELYSKTVRRIIWKQEGEAVYKLGARTPGDEELGQRLASAIAEKFFSDTKSENEEKSAVSLADKCYLTTVSRCNIRKEPSLQSRVVVTVNAGTELEKVAEVGKWINIKLDSGQTGFVYASLVKESSN